MSADEGATGGTKRVLASALGAVLLVAWIALAAGMTRESRALSRMGPPVRTDVASLRTAAEETDRRVALVGGRWRCDEAVQFHGTEGAGERIWIPVEDASGTPRLVIEEFGTRECEPVEPAVGLLTRDKGMLNATLSARGDLFRMAGLPILVRGRRGAGAGGSMSTGGYVALFGMGLAILGLVVLPWWRR